MMNGAVLLRRLDALQPGGESLRDILLPEALLPDTRRIPLHRHRPSFDVRQHDRRDRVVVRGESSFRDAVLREEHFLRVRNHETTSMRRGWRSLPWTVHSMKATRTTISGRTQWARTRGSPFACVNGNAGISIASSRRRSSISIFVSNPVPILP